MAMRPMLRSLLVLAVVGLAAGCRAAPDHVDPWPETPPPPEGEAPVLAVAPLVIDYRPTAPQPPAPNGFRNVLDAKLIRGLLVARLEASGHFARVTPVGEDANVLHEARWASPPREDPAAEAPEDPAAEGVEDPQEPAAAPEEPPEVRARRAFIEQARAAGASLVAELRINSARIKYEERNGLFPLSFALWYLFIFPGWMIRDETYSGNVDVDVYLFDVETGAIRARERLKIAVRRDFNDFDRGFWYILDILRAPDCLDAEDWLMIADWLRKPVAHRVAGDATLWITRTNAARD